MYGGTFIIQHLTLRLLLWIAGHTPRPGKYVEFLNYAARLIILRKVGGGYIFIHHFLQEYFAAMHPLE